ncbi:hypothetical protein CPS_0818 [Colwellia psychrerythraea 34H]|uniref:Uncharacterized protein n=1 Tax=Colwellia psychrerythraea (strain 34H / ATCC BAA-681) TaxID=167879 RepID=Q488E8_COLP3|nr:hypothetical protein CPS_0818 [Colwellia psychrerythraea 34H]
MMAILLMPSTKTFVYTYVFNYMVNCHSKTSRRYPTLLIARKGVTEKLLLTEMASYYLSKWLMLIYQNESLNGYFRLYASIQMIH